MRFKKAFASTSLIVRKKEVNSRESLKLNIQTTLEFSNSEFLNIVIFGRLTL